jgi:hypothetical protein
LTERFSRSAVERVNVPRVSREEATGQLAISTEAGRLDSSSVAAPDPRDPSREQSVSDERERVTAYVDGVPSDAERALRRPSRARFILPLAAVLLVGAWLRGLPGFVALELARDHAKCFSRSTLPAEVWSDDPSELAAWFEKRGSSMPPLPRGAAGLSLVGARYCSLGDRSAPHLYYASRRGRVSLFVVPGPLRFERAYAGDVRGRDVRFLRSAGVTLALVSEDREAVDAFAREFTQSVARLAEASATPGR